MIRLYLLKAFKSHPRYSLYFFLCLTCSILKIKSCMVFKKCPLYFVFGLWSNTQMITIFLVLPYKPKVEIMEIAMECPLAQSLTTFHFLPQILQQRTKPRAQQKLPCLPVRSTYLRRRTHENTNAFISLFFNIIFIFVASEQNRGKHSFPQVVGPDWSLGGVCRRKDVLLATRLLHSDHSNAQFKHVLTFPKYSYLISANVQMDLLHHIPEA